MSYFSAKDILWVLEAKVIDFMVSFFGEKVVEVLGCAFISICHTEDTILKMSGSSWPKSDRFDDVLS
jgi:hypothetical protein